MTLHEGRNQQIRRMFDAIGHSVLKLSRERIGPLSDSRLKPGEWRLLLTAWKLKGSTVQTSANRRGKAKRPRRRLRVSSR